MLTNVNDKHLKISKLETIKNKDFNILGKKLYKI